MPRKTKRRRFLKSLILLLLSLGFLGSGVIFLWAATLRVPDLQTFDERKVTQSTKIYDRTGEILLYDIHEDVQRTIIPFEEMSPYIKSATIAIEDADFYEHYGIKPTSIIRAILINLGSFRFEQGGSTITQQVVKNSLLTSEKKITRKLKEWVLALKLERIASKDDILELYLNEAPYGGNLYGIEEASQAFFDKSAKDLTLVESAYLASLPQAPTYYSPYGNNKDKLTERKNLVLSRMQEHGYITEEEHRRAENGKVDFLPQAVYGIRAPHFVFYVREQLEQKYGKDVVERGGLKVVTSLDYRLQEKAEEIVRIYGEENVQKYNAKNASLVAVDPKTGHVLVMVGSRNYFDTNNGGNFNVSLAHRQPGSAFKPFVYARAFMKGYTPETIVFDLQTQFHAGCSSEGKPIYPSVKEEDCYMPTNYDEKFRGPVTFREALAQSINIPSIKVLYLAGLTDSLETARAMGITSLTDPARYGLTLVLGGGEVSLLEMTSAYSVFANSGVRNPHISILKVEDGSGNVLEEAKQREERVIPEEVALQISDILSDNKARAPTFGDRSYLYFENREVAAKTGTTNDYRDAWILGYTPNIAVGAWAGNNDNSPMEKKVAGFIVAPLWNAFMQEVFKELPEENFKKYVYEENVNLKSVLRGIWLGGESYFVDSISGKRATEYTPSETKKEQFVPSVHSILYWVDKNNPHGEKPENPVEDPQFTLWETPVRLWVSQKGIHEGPSNIPAEYDPIHKPEFFPTIYIVNFNTEVFYPSDKTIKIEIEGAGKFGLQGVTMYINGVYIGSTKTRPFVFSFIPEEIVNIEEKNIIRIVGYDSVFNKGEKELVLKIKN